MGDNDSDDDHTIKVQKKLQGYKFKQKCIDF